MDSVEDLDSSKFEYCLSNHSGGNSKHNFIFPHSNESEQEVTKEPEQFIKCFSIKKMTAKKGIKHGRLVGLYTQRERKARISKYKTKLAKWIQTHFKKRYLVGRSESARVKARFDGKFCSPCVVNLNSAKINPGSRILSDREVIQRNNLLKMYQTQRDYNMIVDIAIDGLPINQ